MSAWTTAAIGEVCATFSGGTPSTAHAEYYGGDIPWIASGDLNRQRIESVDGRITHLGLERSSAKLVQAGTPLIALYGATAGVAAMTQLDGAINQAILAMIPRKVDAEFLYQWLSANRDAIIDRYTQGGQPNLSGAIVRSIRIPMPPLDEQRQIAGMLLDADELVATLERQVAKKLAIKQGMMHELLTGKTRRSGFARPWANVRLGEIGQCLIGLTYSPGSVKRSGTLVLRSSNIQGGRLDFSDNVYVDSPIPEKIRVRRNDILICARNGSRRLIGKSVLLDDRVVGQTFGAFMAVYRSDANVFLRYFFQSEEFKRQIDEHLGATINQITNGSLNSFFVALPAPEEQVWIVSQLEDIDAVITSLDERLKKARAVKQGMMQQLLTGKTRLPTEVAS